ncbi:hypothetical protein E6C27_scaffold500G00130 [Cucumis melo var. makuwa]|uniref:Uncharacterized protein n=1 Tax=Cucumis melo var. makuwa TaxID=1194695 RepID=A0A5A7SPN1_CUCMM|nr:hypothetical protein E6C27_scaffold500G00130 [Cucumis melo var. makuwa]
MPAQCQKVKEVGDLMTGEPKIEAPVNGDRHYNDPHGAVEKFLISFGSDLTLLSTTFSSLKQELKNTKVEYDNIIKSVKMLNSGTENLNQILETGRCSNKEGIGYNNQKEDLKKIQKIVFV